MDGIVAGTALSFGQWRFDRRLGGLLRQNEAQAWVPAAIGARAADILEVLLQTPGALVSKDTLMNAVWAGMAVEANNLTVQIATLRRTLDEGRTGESYIQTVAGRGYRFTGSVVAHPLALPMSNLDPVEPLAAPASPGTGFVGARRRLAWRAGLSAAAGMALLLLIVWHGGWLGPPPPPRMSVAVMAFENLSGDRAEDSVAETITDDLTTALSGSTDAAVVASPTARAQAGQDFSMPRIGQRLNVRFVLRGSVRKVDAVLRVNVQLVSTETAALLWSDRVEVAAAGPGAGQEEAVGRLRVHVNAAMVALEVARGRRERPDDPDGFDLYLRARALEFEPPSPRQMADRRGLLEQALRLDPASTVIKASLVEALLDDADLASRNRKSVLVRTSSLLSDIRTAHAKSRLVMVANLHWLSWQQDRCPETVEAARQVIDLYPDTGVAYRWLGDCETRTGHADMAVGMLQTLVQQGTQDSYQSHSMRNLQYALLLLGRYQESIDWGRRALAANVSDVGYERARLGRRLAAAYALSGRIEEARRQMDEASRIQPHFTLRAMSAGTAASRTFATQLAKVEEGMRLAGLRDHADEDADFGAAPDAVLHRLNGATPLGVPGAATIRTDELAALLATRPPIVIDPLQYATGRSIPGAIGLQYAGDAGDLDDAMQDRLGARMHALTHGDRAAPIVAVGWNSESFDGRNLALRLCALGYTHVSWYRGGREAWEARGLPEADLAAQDW